LFASTAIPNAISCPEAKTTKPASVEHPPTVPPVVVPELVVPEVEPVLVEAPPIAPPVVVLPPVVLPPAVLPPVVPAAQVPIMEILNTGAFAESVSKFTSAVSAPTEAGGQDGGA
jgi:hypothetical protein